MIICLAMEKELAKLLLKISSCVWKQIKFDYNFCYKFNNFDFISLEGFLPEITGIVIKCTLSIPINPHSSQKHFQAWLHNASMKHRRCLACRKSIERLFPQMLKNNWK